LRPHTGGVVVTDVSRGMLAQAREKHGLYPALGQVECLPFADGQFARILIVDAFHHFFHHEEAVADLWRVLAPGGRLVIVEPNIARWQVRLIALGETLLLMRSHFYTAQEMLAFFSPYQNARAAADVDSNPFQIVLMVDKDA
ncbi:MAG: methyltransferase domain-containing protein, partial [Anaerolineae bacterium]|nr:methyltransferase domain-containing protein [Anaerolineae bacterium]